MEALADAGEEVVSGRGTTYAWGAVVESAVKLLPQLMLVE